MRLGVLRGFGSSRVWRSLFLEFLFFSFIFLGFYGFMVCGVRVDIMPLLLLLTLGCFVVGECILPLLWDILLGFSCLSEGESDKRRVILRRT